MQTKFKNIFTEPFIQFILLGGLLFLLVSYIQEKKDNASREITIDGDRVGLMLVNYKTQTGNLPTKQQLDAMIDNYIKEEISYREAKKMGLDKDDEIIRRRLSQKFDFMQTDLTEVEPPSADQLKQFYTGNPALFQKDATVSFSHIYFSTDNSTDSIAKQRAVAVLQQLQQTTLQRAPEKGDRFALQYDYTDQAALDIQQNFGNKQMMQELFKAPVNTWVGAVQSGYGWHLLYVSKRDTLAQLPFASIKDDVQTKYTEAAKAAQNKKVFDKLGEKYIINRAYLQTK
jgi:parvulin-like peptidyl-prolyl isomerase